MAYKEHPQSEMWADRWVGSLSDVADIADELLASFRDVGDTPWHFYLEVELLDGDRLRPRTYGSVQDFRRNIPDLNPDLVREATISAFIPRGNAPIDDQQARVNFERGVGVLITVQAPSAHEAFVDVAERRVNEAVERRELPLIKFDRFIDVGSLVLALAAVFVLETTDGDNWTRVGLLLTVAAAAVLLLKRATRWAFPPVEFVREGSTTRARRIARRGAKVVAFAAYAMFLAYLAVLFLERLVD